MVLGLLFNMFRIVRRRKAILGYMDRYGMKYGRRTIVGCLIIFWGFVICMACTPFAGVDIHLPFNNRVLEWISDAISDTFDFMCDYMLILIAGPFVIWGVATLLLLFVGVDLNDKIK